MISAETQGGRWPRLIQAAVDAFSLPDLRTKILFTLALLALYRFVAHIPIPGIEQLQKAPKTSRPRRRRRSG